MRILFDQGTPVALREAFQQHSVRTAYEEGWQTLSNGELLRAAEQAGFDVLLTTDTSLPYQQSLEGRRIAVVILNRNRWLLIQMRIEDIIAAVNSAESGSYSVVDISAR